MCKDTAAAVAEAHTGHRVSDKDTDSHIRMDCKAGHIAPVAMIGDRYPGKDTCCCWAVYVEEGLLLVGAAGARFDLPIKVLPPNLQMVAMARSALIEGRSLVVGALDPAT